MRHRLAAGHEQAGPDAVPDTIGVDEAGAVLAHDPEVVVIRDVEPSAGPAGHRDAVAPAARLPVRGVADDVDVADGADAGADVVVRDVAAAGAEVRGPDGGRCAGHVVGDGQAGVVAIRAVAGDEGRAGIDQAQAGPGVVVGEIVGGARQSALDVDAVGRVVVRHRVV